MRTVSIIFMSRNLRLHNYKNVENEICLIWPVDITSVLGDGVVVRLHNV